MTNKIIKCCAIISTALLLILYTGCTHGKLRSSQVQLVLFRINNGWGYQVVQGNKVYIYQPFIPVIQGERPFPTYVSARNIGQKAIKKILSNEIPAVTLEELRSEGIRCY